MTDLADLADLLADADHVVCMTGAGISAESGIPTFRDALDGLWSRYKPEELATPGAFAADPELVTRWYDERRQKVLACEPNDGHRALVDLEDALEPLGRTMSVVTQNVDGLHVRAGSRRVIEVHGSLLTWRCTENGDSFTELPVPFDTYPPPSPAGAMLRPGVVWFGEALPEHAVTAAQRALEDCAVYLAIGTSGLVFPAAGFVEVARRHGAATIEANLDDTPMTHVFEHTVRGPAGTVLPELVKLTLERLPAGD